jgi:hypothetical protein
MLMCVEGHTFRRMPSSGTLRRAALVRTVASVLTRATWRNSPEDGILHSNRRENLKSYIALTGWALQQRRNVFPVRYELGVIAQKTAFFIVTVVETSDLTAMLFFSACTVGRFVFKMAAQSSVVIFQHYNVVLKTKRVSSRTSQRQRERFRHLRDVRNQNVTK